MARPRIFISSTYYDLKHVRSSLDNFISSLGFDSVLSEKGDIAYSPDIPLDESCYREVENVDVFVIIIGGRYGSEASTGTKKPSKEFFDRYDSVTRKEYESATARNIPIYILVDANVYAEYQTFNRNKDSKDIRYAHVDSVNVFHLIAEILAKPKNNPLHTFVRFGDIETWLREQWAGLFRELLSRMSSERQIESLAAQVEALREVSQTLKKYLETMMPKVIPGEASAVIAAEDHRLAEAVVLERLSMNDWFKYAMRLLRRGGEAADPATVRDAIASSRTAEEFVARTNLPPELALTLQGSRAAQADYNACRGILSLPPIDFGRPVVVSTTKPEATAQQVTGSAEERPIQKRRSRPSRPKK